MSSIAFADERLTKPLVMSNSNSDMAAFHLWFMVQGHIRFMINGSRFTFGSGFMVHDE